MEGDSNGASTRPAQPIANKFSGKYDYRLITGGVGHNLPQEAPQAFAQAVVDVDSFRLAEVSPCGFVRRASRFEGGLSTLGSNAS